MVSASELRIGNWVQHEPYPDEKWMVDVELLGSISDGLVFCVGIPLTPEILEMCGFKKDDFSIWEIKDDYSKPFDIDDVFEFSESKGMFTPTTNGGEYSIGKSFKFVHQLQNLIFALTGKELELNL